jgi:CDP-paratose 2-epimerase
MVIDGSRFVLSSDQTFPKGLGPDGISELCSTDPPVSLYGSTKLASEILAQEYGEAYGFPVWINRCGVMAGAGQFGRPDQGIFSFWIHSHFKKKPLRYIGFGGSGAQVRDALHPGDLVPLLIRQERSEFFERGRVCNFGGGIANSMSLSELTEWCDDRFGPHRIHSSNEERAFDLPWVVMDCTRAREEWDWEPTTSLVDILEEIAKHAEQHEDWLEVSDGGMA